MRKAATLYRAGKFNEARILYKKYLAKHPSDAEALIQLAVTSLKLGDHAGAVFCCNRALKIGHLNSQGWTDLGLAFNLLGNVRQAEHSYQQAIKINPQNNSAWCELAACLVRQGQTNAAFQIYQNVLTRDPMNCDAIKGIGYLFELVGRSGDAEQAYRRLLQIRPEAAEIHLRLANIFARNGRLDEARAQYEDAAKSNPHETEIINNLGWIRMVQGELDSSMDAYRISQNIDPENVDAVVGEATVYDLKHEEDKAYQLIKPLLAKNRLSAALALLFAKLCHRDGRYVEAIKYTESVLDGAPLATDARIALQFSLGHLHDALGNYDEAFKRYCAGNALEPTIYVSSQQENKIEQLIHTFGDFSIRQFSNENTGIYDATRLVFIVGMPRSGTTLVEQILGSHPDVFAAGELPYIQEITAKLVESGSHWFSEIMTLDKQQLTDIYNQYMERIHALHPYAPVVVDKMWANFEYLGMIRMLFPNVKIVHCTRNPLDTCLSIFMQNFGGRAPFANNLRNIGHYYKQYRKLMDYWQNKAALDMFELNYEKLVGNQRDVTRRLLEYCGLPWNEACLMFHENRRFTGTVSEHQVRQPIYRGSVARWRRYQKYLWELRAEFDQDGIA
jgi:tetratricopeptide (TPR) repeat protein